MYIDGNSAVGFDSVDVGTARMNRIRQGLEQRDKYSGFIEYSLIAYVESDCLSQGLRFSIS